MVLLALVIAFFLGFLMRLLGFPPMLGFLLAGFTLNFFGYEDTEGLARISDLGILLLLFTIGLKLNIKSLLRKHIWRAGIGHMLISVIIFSLVMALLRYLNIAHFSGLDSPSILIVSFALSFSSTVFAVKVLEDKGEMSSLIGKTAIGILIIQDILAVIFITLSKGETPPVYAMLLFGFPFLRKPLLWLMQRSGHGEMMVLFGFLLALGAAELFEICGLKADLGALVVGLVVANTNKSDELSKTLLNFKEFFLIAFFLRIGLMGELEWWIAGIALILSLLIPIKSFFYFWILTRNGLRSRTSFWISLSLTNYSEFALIIGAVAAKTGLLSYDWLTIFAIAVSISFLICSPLNFKVNYILFDSWLPKFERKKRLADDRPIEIGVADVMIFGMGRIGTTAYDLLASQYGRHIIGLDADYNKVIQHKKEKRNVIVGDATDSVFWENLQSHDVSLVLLSMTNHAANKNAATCLRNGHFQGEIAAIANYEDEKEELQKLGVDTVFNIFEEAGLGFAEHVSELIESGKKEAS